MDLSRIASRVAASRTASISFWSDSDSGFDEVTEPCLCAQGSEEPFYELEDMLGSEDPEKVEKAKEALAESAEKACPYCRGTGVHARKVRREREINWSNTNAMAMMEVLGIEPEYSGSMTVPEARRAIMKAKSRSSLKKFERPEENLTRPRETEDGVTELHSPFFYSQGLSEADIRERMESFEALVDEASANGAKNVMWG